MPFAAGADPDDDAPVWPLEDDADAGVYVPGSFEDSIEGDDEGGPDEAGLEDDGLADALPDEDAPDDEGDAPDACVEEVALDEPAPLVDAAGVDEEPLPDVVGDGENGRGLPNPMLEIVMLNRRLVRQADNKRGLPRRHAARDAMAIVGSTPSAQL